MNNLINPFYISLNDQPVTETIDLQGQGQVMVDLDAEGKIVGVEFLTDAVFHHRIPELQPGAQPELIKKLGELFICRTDSKGRLCVVTPFAYPNDDLIEIYVEPVGNGWFRVTDLAETARYLDILGKTLPAWGGTGDIIFKISKAADVVPTLCEIAAICYRLSHENSAST